MVIGTDDLDFIDELEDITTGNDVPPLNQEKELSSLDPKVSEGEEDKNKPEEDFISSLLKSRGIEDRSKIKFENEEGSVEEVDWDSLSNEDKLNILNSSAENPANSLDDSELLLISIIRNSGMTPSEYLLYIEETGVTRYIQNNQGDHEYSVDQYTDDELFITDFMSRMGDVTEEEANEALERAKSNEALFAKLIGAIRNEYKVIEEENLRQAQIELEQQAQEKYNEFANSIMDEINDFKEFSGYDLNLENDDMLDLYDFITGFDAAGNNYFVKALSDPKILVLTAWFALNGKQMIDDITEYFQKEITLVRKESYKKGQEDAKLKMEKSDVVFKTKPTNYLTLVYSDLDDF